MVSRNCDTTISPGEKFFPNLHKCGASRNLQHCYRNVHFIEFVIKCQNVIETEWPKNRILGLKRPFFDFRGMYLALLVFENQEYCTLIDKVLR